MTYPNGDVFDGIYVNGVKCGKGTFSYSNGDRYVGDFANNVKEGMGEYIFKDGRFYQGEFKNDHIVNEDEIQMISDSKRNEEDNNSVDLSREGSVKVNTHVLDFGNHSPEDTREKLISREEEDNNDDKMKDLQNGEQYQGDMINGLKEGKGVCFYPDGDKYEGYFVKDKKEGKGVMNYADGTKYEGDFKNDIKEGKGKIFYNNGETYEGDFKNFLLLQMEINI